MFYIINKEYSRSSDYTVFWRPEAKGYTHDLRMAGLFSQEDCDRVKHNIELVFVPEDVISSNDVKMVIPFGIIKERVAI